MTRRLILLNDFTDVELRTVRHCGFRGCSVIKPLPCTKAQLMDNNGLVQKNGLASAELLKSLLASSWMFNYLFFLRKKKGG